MTCQGIVEEHTKKPQSIEVSTQIIQTTLVFHKIVFRAQVTPVTASVNFAAYIA